MNNRPSAEDAAKEILRIAVREMRVKAGEAINAQPFVARFNNLPWTFDDLKVGLMCAQEKGWVTREGQLTQAGFSAAPHY